MCICGRILESYVYLWQATVKKMLADIQARGEEGALDWAKKLDGEDDEDTGDGDDAENTGDGDDE